MSFPPLDPWHVAYGLWSTRSGRKIEDCGKCSETLESLNICWNRSPCKNWGTNSLCRPSYCPSRLSSHGTWPMAYGLWSTRFGRKIEDCSKCSETSKSLNICWYRCACKIWDSNSLCRPRFCRSRLSSHGTWPMAYGARVSVKRSRIVRNAPKLLSPSTFVGIDVHVKFGTQIRCVGQVIVAPASRPVARGLWPMDHPFGRKIKVVRNAPKLCRSFLYVLRKDHAKNRLKIHCSD